MSKTRIYHVAGSDEEHLVRADSKAQALRYVARRTFIVTLAAPQRILDMVSAGGFKVEHANAEKPEPRE